jgi:MoaA/NifB/PqqE/SkfB family radical SAM enzyme
MDKIYKLIGYYDNILDCKHLFVQTADEVIEYMKKGFGEFHSITGDDDTDVTWGKEQDMHLFLRTADEQYAVRYERGNEKEGWFIDIYKLREPNEVTEVEEYCHYCESYVMLVNDLKVQKCPNCGKAIVPCGPLCPISPGEAQCSKCPLSKLCEIQNGEDKYAGVKHSLRTLEALIKTLSDFQLDLGMNITVPKEEGNDNSCDEELYLHYNSLYQAVVLINTAQHGVAYTWNSRKITSHILHEAFVAVCGREITELYVRTNFS